MQDKTFKTWNIDEPVNEEFLSTVSKKEGFNGSIAVFPVSTASDIYMLHKHFCLAELDQMKILTQQIQQEIKVERCCIYLIFYFLYISYLIFQNWSRELTEFQSWPYGISKMLRPKNRFEIQKWDFFTDHQIFENSNPQNSRPLTGINNKDIENILEYLRTELPKSNSQSFDRLLNGYRKFDPTRGMEYMVDVVLSDPQNGKEVKKVSF